MENLEYKGFTGIIFYDGRTKEYIAGIEGKGPLGAPLVAARAASYEELETAFRTHIDQYETGTTEMGATSAHGMTFS